MSSETDVRPATPADLVAIRQIREIGLEDVLSVGGKGANLGELTRCGLPVPGGFVVTAESYILAMDAAGCRDELARRTAAAPDMSGADLAQFAATARDLVRGAGVPETIARAVTEAHARMDDAERVAVRSSVYE